MEVMDSDSEGHLCKSAPRSAADFGWEADGFQSKFRGAVNVALKLPGISTEQKVTEITLFQKVELLYVTHNIKMATTRLELKT